MEARVAGQIMVAGDVVADMDMPVLAMFLAGKGEQLRDLATDSIYQAAALRGVSAALAETSGELTEAGLEEMAEGATRLAVSRGMEVGSEVLAAAGALEVAEGMEDLAASEALDEVA